MSVQLAAAESRSRIGQGLLPCASVAYPQVGHDSGVAAVPTEDLADHLRRFGDRPSAGGHAGLALLGILDEAGLTGHGGGHFLVARKWRTALRAGGGGIVVANAAESEPRSAKDRALLATAPHLVLDGLACTAEALGAQECVMWMHEDSADARQAVSRALTERRCAGLPELPVRQELAPDRYLSGESSAVLQALSGKPALPIFSLAPAAESGYRGRPAIVHNVETLARIGLLARTGVREYSRTALVTVNTASHRRVLELDDTVTLGEAVYRAGWPAPAPQALLVGGYGGSWLKWPDGAPLRLRENELRTAGASLGAGVLIPLGAHECGVARTADIAGFLADASARQCGPCRFGLRELADRLAALAGGKARRDEIAQLGRLSAIIDGRGGCHHPDGAVRMVATSLVVFAEDVARHARGLRCAAENDSITAVR